MKFEKKYWSEGEFTSSQEIDKSFTGYVGICNGKAYNFQTKEELIPLSTYINHINTSTQNFDRTLSYKLKLPYGKNDISFAANDFLYGGTIKSIIEKLQKNNDYLFQNSIISNSALPHTNKCVLYTSFYEKGNLTEPVRGKLAKGDFATSAFISKVEDDDRFFPSSEEVDEYYAKTSIGLTTFETSKDLRYISIEDSEDDKLDLGTTDAETIWVQLNGEAPFDDTIEVSEDEAKGIINTNQKAFPMSEYSFNGILGEFNQTISTAKGGENKYTCQLKLKTDAITNALHYLEGQNESAINDQLNLAIKSLSFVVEGEISQLTFDINGSNGINPSVHTIADNIYYLTYEFTEKQKINITNTDLENGFITLTPIFAAATKFAALNGNIKFDAKYTIGNVAGEIDTSNYKYIPEVKRNVSYHFAWKDGISGDIRKVPSTYSYSYLKESEEWRNAEEPMLVMNKWKSDESEVSDFIVTGDMTAGDVYAYLLESPDLYEYPALYKSIEYMLEKVDESPKYIRNQAYIPKIYSLNSYAIETADNGIQKFVTSYKTLGEIYDDLSDSMKNNYDKVPEVYKRTRIVTKGEDKLWHNFNEVTSSDIVIKNVNENEGKADILVFLAFKTKLIIFKTNYYFNDESKNFAGESIYDAKKLDKDFIINLTPEDQEYIEISRIDPADSTSLELHSLNCVKIHNNTMYLVDNELDMVLRYDIDYLVSEIESENNAFSLKSIKLLDVLQGSGTSTDKTYFNNPYSIAVSDDRVVIADRGNRCLKMYTPSLNFIKLIKNGPFSKYDVQAVAINPFPCIINDIQIKADSIWVASAQGTSIFLTILENDIIKVHGRVEDINLLQDEYSWVEEVRGIVFSETHSNYFYLNTSKRIYKFHVSKPFSPYASVTYFNQRALVGAMRWDSLRWPWHSLPYVYAQSESNPDKNEYTTLKWDYVAPSAGLELLDNKCFCLTSSPLFKGDIIFHFGLLYNESKVHDYIKTHKDEFGGTMTFYDITPGALADMITSCAILMYKESDSYISSLANENMKIHDMSEIENNIENDYINALTFNKLIHSLACNLIKIKNSLVGHFRAATTIDNIIAFDNLILDDYFNNLKAGQTADYFIHDNESMSIIANRTFENILDIQEKILAKMQTEFMAAQSFVNNASRII